jgi:outer membrane protein assembly factor BamE (lipoprotein component of BamABCDE complex)
MSSAALLLGPPSMVDAFGACQGLDGFKILLHYYLEQKRRSKGRINVFVANGVGRERVR